CRGSATEFVGVCIALMQRGYGGVHPEVGTPPLGKHWPPRGASGYCGICPQLGTQNCAVAIHGLSRISEQFQIRDTTPSRAYVGTYSVYSEYAQSAAIVGC